MKKQKYIYIAGPMTGKPDFNFPAFDAAGEYYSKRGWGVINPATIARRFCREHHISLKKLAGNADYMAQLMRLELGLIPHCDALHLLPGWRRSKGAQREYDTFYATRIDGKAKVYGSDAKKRKGAAK